MLGITREQAFALRRRRTVRQLTPEQQAANLALAKKVKADAADFAAWAREWNLGVEAGRNLGPALLTERGKVLQELILRRDWESLFTLIPVNKWPRNWSLSKYSFTGNGANKRYVAWTKADLQSFIFSPYYTVQPGYICLDEQRSLGVAAYWKAQSRHKQKFNPSSYHYVWPIYPGGGYGSQTYGCEKDKTSLWVKIRKPVIAAAAIVAAVYLGPIVLAKISGVATTGATEAATAGIVGAGTKAGAVTAITTKAGTAAAITLKSGAVAAAAAESTSFFQTVQSGANNLLNYVNKARTVEAIAKGEMPPPPISVVGASFTDWAMIVAKEQIAKEAQQRAIELGTEYIQRKMTEKEEARLRAEIKVMQAELALLIPDNVIASPDSRVPAEVQAASAALALKEKQAQAAWLTALAIAVPVGFLLL